MSTSNDPSPQEEQEWNTMEQILLRLLTEAFNLEHIKIDSVVKDGVVQRHAQHVFMDESHDNFWRFTPSELTAHIKAAARSEMDNG
jgi:hypothetical protein